MMGGLDRSFGPTAVLRVGGRRCSIVTERERLLDLQQLRTFGIEPAGFGKVLAAERALQAFPRALPPSRRDRGLAIRLGCRRPDPSRSDLRPASSRPIWPLDKEIVFKAATSIVALDTAKHDRKLSIIERRKVYMSAFFNTGGDRASG